jgi:16S rRNA (guanine527-N7)-methyltransferase
VHDEIQQRLGAGLAAMGVATTPELVSALVRYLVLLETWNRAYNLTSISEPDDMVVRHILDSVTARSFLGGAAIADVGTGAGLPGIPLALLEPGRQFTLLDSVGKKTRFLRQVVTELRLPNVALAHARLENWRPGKTFDTIICRAFSSLADFVSLSERLVAPGGRLVAMKGREPAEEIAAVPQGWQVSVSERVTVPGLEAERHIVVLERRAHG